MFGQSEFIVTSEEGSKRVVQKIRERRVVEDGPDLFGNPDQLLKKPGASVTKNVLQRKKGSNGEETPCGEETTT